jgi:hypothetical protein
MEISGFEPSPDSHYSSENIRDAWDKLLDSLKDDGFTIEHWVVPEFDDP